MAEKAKSKDQIKFFNIVKDVQQGDIKKDKVTKNVQMVADKMSEKDVDSIASTPSKGLPKKVKQEQFKQLIQKLIREEVVEINGEPVEELPRGLTDKIFSQYTDIDIIYSLVQFYKRNGYEDTWKRTQKTLDFAIKLAKM